MCDGRGVLGNPLLGATGYIRFQQTTANAGRVIANRSGFRQKRAHDYFRT